MSFQEREFSESEMFSRLNEFSQIAIEIVMCASLFASFAIRRPWHDPQAIPFKSILGSIASMVIVYSISLATSYGGFGNNALGVVSSVFSYVQLILVMNAFYGLIYAYNSRIGTRKLQSKRRLLLGLQHGLLALMIGVSIVIIVLSIIIDTTSGGSEYETLTQALDRFYLARGAIFFVASLEIVLEICIIGWRSRCRDSIFKLQNGFLGFVVGSIFNLVFNIMYLVETSKDMSCSSYLTAKCEHFTYRANLITTFVCMLGLYSGIFHCCMQWYKFPRSS